MEFDGTEFNPKNFPRIKENPKYPFGAKRECVCPFKREWYEEDPQVKDLPSDMLSDGKQEKE